MTAAAAFISQQFSSQVFVYLGLGDVVLCKRQMDTQCPVGIFIKAEVYYSHEKTKNDGCKNEREVQRNKSTKRCQSLCVWIKKIMKMRDGKCFLDTNVYQTC